MISYLPTLYPDELVYSWFCRYYIHAGCLASSVALQDLYCKRSDNPSKEFIGNLNMDALEKISRKYSMEELVLQHTMYPMYGRFLPLEKKKAALRGLGYEVCDPHQLFGTYPRIGVEQYLRFCPLCVQEERLKYGETYWHRKHQIRNMGICTKHHCHLVESEVLMKSEKSFIFQPAEIYVRDCEAVLEENPFAIRFAEYLEAVFDAPFDFDKDIPISAVLYHSMSKTEYLKASGRSRYTKKMADDMSKFYEDMGIRSIATIHQIQRVLLGSRFDFSVVCQIGFFLGIQAEELTAPVLTEEQIQQEQSSHYMKAAVPVNWELLDAEKAPVLEKIARSVYDGTANKNGRPERVSERLVYRELELLGQQLENLPRCKAIFERYTESYPENWARKIIWAYQKLEERGDPFYWSDIRKLSGVKKENFQSAIPYLTMYPDADMVENIIALAER